MVIHEYKNTAGKIYLTIEYDPALNCVTDTWTGPFGTQENFKKCLEKIVDIIEEKKCTRWLANLSKMEGSWESSREWMVNTLMPRAINAGLLYEAIVLPKEIFSKLSTVNTIIRLNNYELRQFDDLNEAKSWIENK